MARPFTPKVVTANHLIDGEVIYLGRSGSWERHLAHAVLYTTEAAAEDALAQAQSQAHLAVGAYLAEATAGLGGPEPTHFREAFRSRGPSNYAHGKQTERAHV